MVHLPTNKSTHELGENATSLSGDTRRASDTLRLSVDRTGIIRLQVCWESLHNWGPLRLRGEVTDMGE